MKGQHLLSLFFLVACMTTQKSFEKKQYKQAFRLALSKMQKGKEVEIKEPILHQSLDILLQPILHQKDSFQNIGTIAFLNKALKKNEDALKYLRKAQRFSTPKFDSIRNKLIQEVPQINAQIAQLYIDHGQDKLNKALENNNKILAQKAYQDFRNAKEHGRLDQATDSLQAYSLDFGQVIVVVTTDVWSPSMQWDVDRAFDNIGNCGGLFLQVYYNSNPTRRRTDCILDFNFSSVDFDTDDSEVTHQYETKVIDKYKTVTDTSGVSTQVPVYETVTASAEVITRTKTATLSVNMSVRSQSPNCRWSSCHQSRTITSEVEIIETSGDERALPHQYQHIFGIQDDVEDDDDMEEELVELIYRDIVRACF